MEWALPVGVPGMGESVCGDVDAADEIHCQRWDRVGDVAVLFDDGSIFKQHGNEEIIFHHKGHEGAQRKKMEYFILALATWRISSLLVNEAGPGNIFRKIREWAGIGHDEAGNVYMVPDRFFAKLLSCVWCASLWVGLGWAGISFLLPHLAKWMALPFALSAGAILMECAVDALKRFE